MTTNSTYTLTQLANSNYAIIEENWQSDFEGVIFETESIEIAQNELDYYLLRQQDLRVSKMLNFDY